MRNLKIMALALCLGVTQLKIAQISNKTKKMNQDPISLEDVKAFASGNWESISV